MRKFVIYSYASIPVDFQVKTLSASAKKKKRGEAAISRENIIYRDEKFKAHFFCLPSDIPSTAILVSCVYVDGRYELKQTRVKGATVLRCALLIFQAKKPLSVLQTARPRPFPKMYFLFLFSLFLSLQPRLLRHAIGFIEIDLFRGWL